MKAPSVFVSYSHKDEQWKDRLLPQLRALEQAGRVTVWDDRKIGGGERWYDEIEEAMADAAVAVCLISPDYLASDFVIKEEVTYLLKRREETGLVILPVLLRDCAWRAFDWISGTQMIPRDGKTVAEDFQGRENRVFVDYAQQCVKLADRSGDAFLRMARRATLANALHQAGQMVEAEALYREAEAMQSKDAPDAPLLFSRRGFLYCDLLLGQGKHEEVQGRAAQTLEWAIQWRLALITVAMDHLSLGRAVLLQARKEGTHDLSEAARELDQGVDGLRQAGQQQELPRGLLARAELHLTTGDFPAAERDLEEALAIAERGSMGLFQADAHLGYARLHLATGERDKARESLATAKKMIGDMGYHRRDGEVEELERELAQASE